MIKAILFDVDGVLYDSMPSHAKSWQKAFKLINFRLPAKEVYLGEGRRDDEFASVIVNKYKISGVSRTTVQEIAKNKVKEFENLPKPRILKGAKQFIRRVKSSGKNFFLVTGSAQPKTLKRLKQDFGIERQSILTGAEVHKGKPNPELFLKAARKLGVKVSECLVIENAPLGIIAARRAGMICLAINIGMLPDSILKRAGAKKVYRSYQQLMKLKLS